jgi:hypothetical protein
LNLLLLSQYLNLLIPEFTIGTVSFPYDVPITHSIDPYTGKEINHTGYHVENKTTWIRIKNQQFSGAIFYNIRFKGHFSNDWGYYRLHNGSSDGNLMQDNYVAYTVVPIDSYLPSEGQVDFQIEALTGYERGISTPLGTPRVIIGETSGWSNIQTLNIADGSVSITPSQTQLLPLRLYKQNHQQQLQVQTHHQVQFLLFQSFLG